jgi:hypothetical protein
LIGKYRTDCFETPANCYDYAEDDKFIYVKEIAGNPFYYIENSCTTPFSVCCFTTYFEEPLPGTYTCTDTNGGVINSGSCNAPPSGGGGGGGGEEPPPI